MTLGWWILSGCAVDPIEARVADVVALDGDAVAGSEAFSLYCAQCHGADGAGGEDWVGADVRGEAPETTVRAMLVPPDGMIGFSDLSDQELADLAAAVEAL